MQMPVPGRDCLDARLHASCLPAPAGWSRQADNESGGDFLISAPPPVTGIHRRYRLMNKAGFLFLGAVLSIAGTSAMIAGCGGDTGTGTTTTGAGGGGSTTAATSGGTGGADATSSSSTGSPATLDCASYCTEVMANCTGANEQYAKKEACLTVCAAFTPGKITDTDGNSLGCRLYHG